MQSAAPEFAPGSAVATYRLHRVVRAVASRAMPIICALAKVGRLAARSATSSLFPYVAAITAARPNRMALWHHQPLWQVLEPELEARKIAFFHRR